MIRGSCKGLAKTVLATTKTMNQFSEKTMKALRWMVGLLEEGSVPYQISGGFAARVYGSTRSLNDIDFDVPEESLGTIYQQVKKYVTYGPDHYNDGKWDLDIMTLDYHGQEIDIAGAHKVKVSNRERTEWIPIPVDFSKVKKVQIEDLFVNVIPPEDLIKYKIHLDGDHQIADIEATKKYIANSGNRR